MRLGFVLPLALALTITSGCSDSPVQEVCTLVGCLEGVTVELSGDIPAELTVTISGTGIQEKTVQWDCTTYSCGELPVASLDGSTPEEVTITISAEGIQRTQSFRPVYTELAPNGPGCPPVCRRATVEVVI